MVWQSAGRLPAARPRHDAGQLVEARLARDEHVEGGVAQQVEREGQAGRPVVRARCGRATRPDLAGAQPRRPLWNAPPARAAPRRRRTQLRSSTVPSARAARARAEPGRRRGSCARPGRSRRRRRPAREAGAERGRRPRPATRPTSTSVTSSAGNRAQQAATLQPTIPRRRRRRGRRPAEAASHRALTAVSTVRSTARAAARRRARRSRRGRTYVGGLDAGSRQKTVRPRSSGGPCSTAPTFR
jgi:hypothetical protein